MADGAISQNLMENIYMINNNSPYLGIAVTKSSLVCCFHYVKFSNLTRLNKVISQYCNH